MIFWASAEVHLPVYDGLVRAERYVASVFAEEVAQSSLDGLDLEVRYVPIVMPDDAKDRYPARSRLRRRPQ